MVSKQGKKMLDEMEVVSADYLALNTSNDDALYGFTDCAMSLGLSVEIEDREYEHDLLAAYLDYDSAIHSESREKWQRYKARVAALIAYLSCCFTDKERKRVNQVVKGVMSGARYSMDDVQNILFGGKNELSNS